MSKEDIGEMLVEVACGIGGALLIGYQTNWKVGLGAFLLAVYTRMAK
jgi:hypothetical protein